jgi:hypothetical protein
MSTSYKDEDNKIAIVGIISFITIYILLILSIFYTDWYKIYTEKSCNNLNAIKCGEPKFCNKLPDGSCHLKPEYYGFNKDNLDIGSYAYIAVTVIIGLFTVAILCFLCIGFAGLLASLKKPESANLTMSKSIEENSTAVLQPVLKAGLALFGFKKKKRQYRTKRSRKR